MLKKAKPYLMLAPVMTVLLLVFAAGLAMGFLQSLGYFPALGLREITLKHYRAVFSDPAFLKALLFSLYTALVSSIVAVVAGLLLAYALMRSCGEGVITRFLYQLPIVVPHTVAAFLAFSLLGQSGWLSRLAFQAGLTGDMAQFPVMILDTGGLGIMAAYLWKETPFVALVVYGVLKSSDSAYGQAARNLGATGGQTFVHVTLPLSVPTLMTAFIMTFTYAFGAFEIPYLLGPTAPKALPVLSYLAYIHPDLGQRPYAMAINMVLAGLTLLMVLLYSWCYRVIERTAKAGGGQR